MQIFMQKSTHEHHSAKHPAQQANMAFRVPLDVKKQFALLMQSRGKKGVELFTELVAEAFEKPLSNRELRALSPAVRKHILAEQSIYAEHICRAVAADLAIQDIADDVFDLL
jgi:hypothetical protein